MNQSALYSWMQREGVAKVERYVAGRLSVVLMDGRIGVGRTAAEALKKAKADTGSMAA